MSQQEYDWYKTKTLEEISGIKEKNGCIWCPECEGRGYSDEGILFKRQVACPRCKGRRIIAAGDILRGEAWELSSTDRHKVAEAKHPMVFSYPLPTIEFTQEDLETLKKWLEQRATKARFESFRYMKGSGSWALERGEKRAYENVLEKIELINQSKLWKKVNARMHPKTKEPADIPVEGTTIEGV